MNGHHMPKSSPIRLGAYTEGAADSPTPSLSPMASYHDVSAFPTYEYSATEKYVPRTLTHWGEYQGDQEVHPQGNGRCYGGGLTEFKENEGTNLLDNPAIMRKVYNAIRANNMRTNRYGGESTPLIFPNNIWSPSFQSQRGVSLSGTDERIYEKEQEVYSPTDEGDRYFWREPEPQPSYILHTPQPCKRMRVFLSDTYLEDDEEEKAEVERSVSPIMPVVHEELIFRDQNGRQFTVPSLSRFVVIKSNNFLDIFASFKNKVWSSTELGNKRLNKTFQSLPLDGKLFLFYLVNGSGQFCGISQMCSEVDYTQSCNIWVEPTRYKGIFPVDWLMVKNVPNKYFHHLRIPENDNKLVTCSRDTQEMPYEVGIAMLKIFSSFRAN